MKKLSYKTLYIAWAVMFVLTAALGFAFPEVENGWGRIGLALVAVLFCVVLTNVLRIKLRFRFMWLKTLCSAWLVVRI